MPHKVRTALEELDRRLTEKLNGSKATFSSNEKDPLKQVIQARFIIDLAGISPPLSLDDIWKHCVTRRFAYTRSVSIQKPNRISIYIKR